MLEKEFQAIGLNSNEREVYLAILRAGKASPTRIAKETSINRTTVYSISRKLLSLGLIGEDLGAKVAYLYAEPPEALAKIFAKEEGEIQRKKGIAQQISQQLASLPKGTSYSVPKIKFIEEENLNEFLYKEYAKWADSGSYVDNTWWGYIDSSFTNAYKGWIDWTWIHGPKGQKVKFLTNEHAAEDELSTKYPERRRKILNDKVFDSSLFVIGDFVCMAQSRERPNYLVEINDPVFARNQRQLFKMLWSLMGDE
jgi:predicted transcriptional regulator